MAHSIGLSPSRLGKRSRLNHKVAVLTARSQLWFAILLLLGTGCAGPKASPETPDPKPPAPSPPASAVATAVATVATTPAPPPAPNPPPVPKGTTVLHLGDSFVHAGLKQRLTEHFAPLEVRYIIRTEVSTNTLDWSRRVPADIAQAQPDLVIITLGANEIGSPYLSAQGRAIKKIVQAVGDRPCVWTTPPLWREEAGFFDTLQANVSPCRYFETDVHVGAYLPRRDTVHPTDEAGARWADALFDYLLNQRVGDANTPWKLLPSPAEELAPRGHRKPLPET